MSLLRRNTIIGAGAIFPSDLVFDFNRSVTYEGIQRAPLVKIYTVTTGIIEVGKTIVFDWQPDGGDLWFGTNFYNVGAKHFDPNRVNKITMYSAEADLIHYEITSIYDADYSAQEVFVDDFNGSAISPLWEVTESEPTTFNYIVSGGRMRLDANVGDTAWIYFKSPMSNSVMGDTPISFQWYVSEVNNQAEIIFNVRLFNEDNQSLCYLYPDGSSNFRVAYYNIGSVGNNEIDESTVAPHWGDPIRLRINENGQLYVQQWDTISWKNLANMPQPSGPFAEERVLGKKLYARFDFRNRNSNKDEYLDYAVLAEGNYVGYKPTQLPY